MSVESIMKVMYDIEATHITKRVFENVAEMNKEFLSCMTKVASATIGKHVHFSPLTISTITITGKFTSSSDIYMKTIRDELLQRSPEDGLCHVISKVKKHRNNTFNDLQDSRKFDHQIPFRLGTNSVKLFSNKTMHATGFSSLIDFLYMSELIAQFVEEVTGVSLILDDVGINMTNSGFVIQSGKFPLSFAPKIIFNRAVASNYEAFFDPERHPAVKLVLHKDTNKIATALIFATGNVQIFGTRDISGISEIFGRIIHLLNDVVDLGNVSALRSTTVTKDIDFSHGYLTQSYKLCV